MFHKSTLGLYGLTTNVRSTARVLTAKISFSRSQVAANLLDHLVIFFSILCTYGYTVNMSVLTPNEMAAQLPPFLV